MGAKYIGTSNSKGLSAGVFFLFFYIWLQVTTVTVRKTPQIADKLYSYGSCIDATTYVYVSEIFPTHLRARGLSFGVAILFLSTIAYLEAAPTAFAQVGWKYYLLFIILTIIHIPLIWYLFPETMGLSLEEIGEKFGDEVVVHLTNLTDEQRAALDKEIDAKEGTIQAVHAQNGNATNGHAEKALE